jgi:hypothetical protein
VTAIDHALTNSFGFGGQNVSLVVSGASTDKKRNGQGTRVKLAERERS